MQAPTHPNVLILEWDEMRADCMGCMGNTLIQTPNLDRLAAISTLFSDHHTVSPVCAPARHAFFSGKYPHCINATSGGLPLRRGEAACYWPQVMEDNGYLAGVVGKLHHCPTFEPYGFSWTKITDQPHRPGSAHGTWLKEQGIDYKELRQIKDSATYNKIGPGWGLDPVPEEYNEASYLTREAIGFIEMEHDKPWMLHVSCKQPHSPSSVPAAWMDMYADVDIPVPPPVPTSDGSGILRWQRESSSLCKMTPEHWPDFIRHYYALISYLDSEVGKILDAVERTGGLDDTIILFTSDHGTMIGDHGMYGKVHNYEPSTHIPLLFHQPGQTEPQRIDTTNTNIDVMPTVLELCNVPCPPDVQGRSLMPLIRGEDVQWDERFYMEITAVLTNKEGMEGTPRERICDPSRKPGEPYIHLWRRGMRTKDWKLTYERFFLDGEWRTEWQLYDRHADPEELNNLARDPANALLLSDLKDEFIELMLTYEAPYDYSRYGEE